MDTNPDQALKNPAEEARQAQTERALELEQLEDREFQGTYRHDQASN